MADGVDLARSIRRRSRGSEVLGGGGCGGWCRGRGSRSSGRSRVRARRCGSVAGRGRVPCSGVTTSVCALGGGGGGAAAAARAGRSRPWLRATSPRFGSDETVIVVAARPRWSRVGKASHVGRDDDARRSGAIVRAARALEVERERAGRCSSSTTPGWAAAWRISCVEQRRVPGRAVPWRRPAREQREHPNSARRGVVRVRRTSSPSSTCDPDEQLAADLVAPRYSLDSQGRRVVEPKSETKRRLRRGRRTRGDAVRDGVLGRGGGGTGRGGRVRGCAEPAAVRGPAGQAVDVRRRGRGMLTAGAAAASRRPLARNWSRCGSRSTRRRGGCWPAAG